MKQLRLDVDRKPMDPETLRQAAAQLRAAAETFEEMASREYPSEDAVTDNGYDVIEAIACVMPGPDGEHFARIYQTMNDDL